MKVIWAGVAAVLFAFAGAASAQEAAPAVKDGRARAEAIIAEAGVSDLFENITKEGDEVAAVRHRASGLSCMFPPQATGKILLPPLLPRGDDVGCDMQMGAILMTLYATRRPGASVKTELEETSRIIRDRWPSAKPRRPTGISKKLVPADKWPKDVAHGTNWFSVRGVENVAATRVSVAIRGDWVFTMRATSATELHAEVTELLTDMIWLDTLESSAPAAAPAS